uniref:Uncharacterized protein n=1 Tax=Aplanochytrium stocchinoi TaxID=215587 RepID=A0A7S3PPW4_9STRA|mmetsp:Transcript_18756/g.23872  ORF Transcript_18756/g.23872 Transcript_18756/m.23872 type:complete len:371 (+) Transcript_18756:193-1305(+)
MPCLDLWPAKPCGSFGECTIAEANNISEELCVCQPGWKQSEEFVLWPSTKGSSLCCFNESILQYLFILAFVFSSLNVTAITSLIYTRKSWSHVRKVTSALLMWTFASTASLYRLIKPEDALYGKDVAFSFLVANYFTLQEIDMSLYFNKYVQFLIQKLAVSENMVRLKRQGYMMSRFAIALNIFQVMVFNLHWVAFTYLNEERARTMHRIFGFIMGLRAISNIAQNDVLVGGLIRDIEKYLLVGASSNVAAEIPQVGFAKGIHPVLKNQKKVMKWFAAFTAFMTILLTCWNYLLHVATSYIVPSWWLLIGASHLNAIRNKLRISNEKKKQLGVSSISSKDINSALDDPEADAFVSSMGIYSSKTTMSLSL